MKESSHSILCIFLDKEATSFAPHLNPTLFILSSWLEILPILAGELQFPFLGILFHSFQSRLIPLWPPKVLSALFSRLASVPSTNTSPTEVPALYCVLGTLQWTWPIPAIQEEEVIKIWDESTVKVSSEGTENQGLSIAEAMRDTPRETT